VVTAVHFDDELPFQADEVDDIAADRALAAKLVASEAPSS